MILCYGIYDCRHWINNNSIQEEYKIWVLVAETYGSVVEFRPSQGEEKKNNIRATGLLKKNRLRKCCTIIGDKQLQKKERGHF